MQTKAIEEKHTLNLTHWTISFDKQSVSGICIMESDVSSEQVSSQMQNYLFNMSVKTQRKNRERERESNERRPTSPLQYVYGEVHLSSPN